MLRIHCKLFEIIRHSQDNGKTISSYQLQRYAFPIIIRSLNELRMKLHFLPTPIDPTYQLHYTPITKPHPMTKDQSFPSLIITFLTHTNLHSTKQKKKKLVKKIFLSIFQGLGPSKKGPEVPRFPVPPTESPPAASPPACTWAIVVCCKEPTRRDPMRLQRCLEATDCPGANWDSQICSPGQVRAANAEIMRFYLAAQPPKRGSSKNVMKFEW